MIFMVSINSFISFIARFFVKKQDSVYNESAWCIILDGISLILLSFGGILFNEILIVNTFGLSQKTRTTLRNFAEEEIINEEKEDL